MKKITLYLSLILLNYSLHSTEQHLSDNTPHTQLYTAPQLVEEEDESALEYEKYVCDTVKPEQPSAVKAYIRHIGGTVLIRCILLQEQAKRYYNDLINICKRCCQWIKII
jgi:hypothetical protein